MAHLRALQSRHSLPKVVGDGDRMQTELFKNHVYFVSVYVCGHVIHSIYVEVREQPRDQTLHIRLGDRLSFNY